MNKWTPVRVEWVDSAFIANEWAEIPEEVKAPMCESVGYFVKESDDAVLLAMSKGHKDDEDETAADLFVIPKVAVKKVTKLRAG